MSNSIEELRSYSLEKITAELKELLESAEYQRSGLARVDSEELQDRLGHVQDLKEQLLNEKRQHSYWWLPPIFAPAAMQRFIYLEQGFDTLIERIKEVRAEMELRKMERIRKKEFEATKKKRRRAREDLKRQHFEAQGFNKLIRNITNGYSIDFLWAGEIEAIKRKRDALDELYYEGVREGNAGMFRMSINKLDRTVSGTVSTLKVFAEETSFGLVKAISMFLAWPYLAPIKAINWLTRYLVEKPLWAVGGFFETFRVGIPKWFAETFPFTGDWKSADFWKQPLNYVMLLPRAIGGALSLAAGLPEMLVKGGALISNIFRHVIDTDFWFRESPITSAYARAAFGVITFVAIALAGIASFGIVPAIWFGAIGLGVALAGALSIYIGYRAANKRAEELSTLKLPIHEELELAKAEYDAGVEPDKGAKPIKETPILPPIRRRADRPAVSKPVVRRKQDGIVHISRIGEDLNVTQKHKHEEYDERKPHEHREPDSSVKHGKKFVPLEPLVRRHGDRDTGKRHEPFLPLEDKMKEKHKKPVATELRREESYEEGFNPRKELGRDTKRDKKRKPWDLSSRTPAAGYESPRDRTDRELEPPGTKPKGPRRPEDI